MYRSVVLSVDATGVLRVDDPDDALQVGQRRELDRDPALPLAEVDLDAGLQVVREPGREVVEPRRGRAAAPGRLRLGAPEVAHRDDLLQAAYRDALGDHAP